MKVEYKIAFGQLNFEFWEYITEFEYLVKMKTPNGNWLQIGKVVFQYDGCNFEPSTEYFNEHLRICNSAIIGFVDYHFREFQNLRSKFVEDMAKKLSYGMV